MNKAETKKRIEKLRELINRHRYMYHVLDKLEISDEAFDTLKHELWQLEQQYPDLITPDSPTQRVGGEALGKFNKVEHRVKMLSIEDIFSDEELQNWEDYLTRLSGEKKFEYFAELKMDGFAVALWYHNGILTTGSTRGNGEIGEDITQNLKTIESIPLRLSMQGNIQKSSRARIEQLITKGDIEVRGEVYMEKEAFAQYNEERRKKDEEPYANPRNLAAGSIRQLDPKLTASRPLQFMAYDLVTDVGQTLHSEEHDIVRALGFKTDRSAKICSTLAQAIGYWKSTGERRDTLPFHIDGVVVVVNQNRVFSELGVAGKSPRGMRALKFAGKQATTKVLDIQTQVGRTGAITPVALLEPVQVAGVTISRASLHNQDEIERLDVRIGDTVIVERAGDVIPAVIDVVKDLRDGSEKPYRAPRDCPICDTLLVREKGEVIWRCPNKDCQAQKREILYHFVSKKAFDIDGLGPKILDQLVEQKLISDAADLFTLREEDLVDLERFADKSAANLIEAIELAKTVSLARFVYALGIRHVGEETAHGLSEHFSSQGGPASGWGSIERLQGAKLQELEGIRDIGGVVAQSLHDWFSLKANLQFVLRLHKAGVKIDRPKTGIQKQKFHGKIFVFTGSLQSITRDEAKQKIRNLGGAIAESISAKTDYTVVGEGAGSKLKKAKHLKIRLLTEKEFLKMLQ